MDRVELWNSCLEYLKSKTDNISFSIWFKDAELVKVQDRILVIRVPTIYIKDHINQFYTELLEEMIEKCSDVPYEYEVVIQEDLEKEEVKNEPVIIESGIDLPKFKEDNSNLNSSYTFDNFVVGDTNRFAATVGLSVAEQPGKVYNPLFIYGKSGLGKTHLMHAIGNYIKKNTQKSVLYVTSDTFISDFTNLYKKYECLIR